MHEPLHDLNGEMSQPVKPLHPPRASGLTATTPEAKVFLAVSGVADAIAASPDVAESLEQTRTAELGAFDGYSADADASDLAKQVGERVVALPNNEALRLTGLASFLERRTADILDHARDALSKIAGYAAGAVSGAPGATLRLEAAEREFATLVGRLVETGTGDVVRAKFAAEGIFYLEHVPEETLAKRNKKPAPQPEPTPYKGRREGETRGRRSPREGKRFTVAPHVLGPGPSLATRKGRSFKVIKDAPGILYEDYLTQGGNPADLGLFLSENLVTMHD